MDPLKFVFGVVGGGLVGLQITGHNIMSYIGLPASDQVFIAAVSIFISGGLHVIGGGRIWPFGK